MVVLISTLVMALVSVMVAPWGWVGGEVFGDWIMGIRRLGLFGHVDGFEEVVGAGIGHGGKINWGFPWCVHGV